MTAAQHLSQYGVTIQQAKQFIMENLNNVSNIYNVAKEYGVTNAMLAEIYGGVTENDVKGFFQYHGFNPEVLETPLTVHQSVFLADDMATLQSLVALNTTYSGELSNASLRSEIIANTGADAYYAAFDPSSYEGSDDGIFTPAELGLSQFSNLSASTETIESLFFGTIIKAYKSIDMNEINEISNFVMANQNAIISGNDTVLSQYIDLMIGVFEDPANPQIISDSQIADLIVASGTMYVQLVGNSDAPALFDGMLMGFV